jgi:hypothetical protein
MKDRSPAGLVVGLMAAMLLALPATALAGPASVTVRAEGASGTVLPRTIVTTTTAPVNNDGQAGHECSGTSAAGALQQATGGDWVGEWFGGLGYQVHKIRTEMDDMSTYWYLWVNYTAADTGVCGAELQNGDDVLLYIDCFVACRKPLRLSQVPAKAAPGSTAAVLVREYTAALNGSTTDTTAAPAAGATVTVGGQQFTTDSNGIANVTFPASGPVSLRATQADHVPSATESTCLTTGSDGLCGSVPPPDTTAPIAKITGIRNGKTFSRLHAPRELHGSVTEDPSGLWAVKIRLTRRLGGTCWYFSGSKERFLKRTCGRKYAFKVGDRAEWSYLLPSRLPRGRYVLSTYAIDNAFNHGSTKTVRFRVR